MSYVLTHQIRQWGNVLTLQAAWNDNILRPLFDGILDKQGLSDLLKRTLSFLGIVATRSSALYTDMKILVNAGKYTGLLEKDYQARQVTTFAAGFTSFSNPFSC